MKALGRLFLGLLLLGILFGLTGLTVWYSAPGKHQQQYNRIRIGMTQDDVRAILGSDADGGSGLTSTEYEWRWFYIERGDLVYATVQFDEQLKVVDKWRSIGDWRSPRVD